MSETAEQIERWQRLLNAAVADALHQAELHNVRCKGRRCDLEPLDRALRDVREAKAALVRLGHTVPSAIVNIHDWH